MKLVFLQELLTLFRAMEILELIWLDTEELTKWHSLDQPKLATIL